MNTYQLLTPAPFPGTMMSKIISIALSTIFAGLILQFLYQRQKKMRNCDMKGKSHSLAIVISLSMLRE